VARRTDERGALQVLPNQRRHANHCTIFSVWGSLHSEYQVAAKEGWSTALVVMGYELRVMGYGLWVMRYASCIKSMRRAAYGLLGAVLFGEHYIMYRVLHSRFEAMAL